MNIKLKTAPVKYPVTLEDAKNHLRLELDLTTDDEYIKTLISVATQTAEQFLHRRLITQTWYLYLEGWWFNTLVMPFGQLESVTSIKYKDTDGDESTWSSDEYIVNTDSDPGAITLGYSESFPTDVLYPSNPITIEFVCGYGTGGSDVEANIKHAIKLLISDLYENRETVVISGGSVSLFELPTVINLLTPFKINWF
jgi:uncharacterized phiE125 gp8 family phage protein